jgi:hypothetical protein
MSTNLLLALLLAISKVEGNPSGRDTDGGYTTGHLCISRTAVQDVNKKYGTSFRWTDMRNRKDAETVFFLYAKRWNSRTPEEVARRWNGGPEGMKKKSTLTYWKKVRRELLVMK